MPTKAQIQKFEAAYAKAFKRIANDREDDTRVAGRGNKATKGAYLTQDLLKNRQKLTANGRQRLVLDYGFKGEKREYSLQDLDKMAKRISSAGKEFHGRQKGVLVAELMKKTRSEDKQSARSVAAAVPYKFADNMLFFQVTASGETPKAPSHYRVRVRLEEWDYQVNKHKGNNYMKSAIKATHGRISFDCACGRHQFYYRYLAHIGGFAVEPPIENVFPKIKNPKLRGACCKHVVKVILALQTAPIQGRIARAMEDNAKKHGFGDEEAEFLSTADMKQLEKAGSFNTLGALQKFTKAAKEFHKKRQQPQAKAALEKLKNDNEAQMKRLAEENRVAKAAAKTLDTANKQLANRLKEADRIRIVDVLKTIDAIGTVDKASISKVSAKNGYDEAEVLKIAQEQGYIT